MTNVVIPTSSLSNLTKVVVFFKIETGKCLEISVLIPPFPPFINLCPSHFPIFACNPYICDVIEEEMKLLQLNPVSYFRYTSVYQYTLEFSESVNILCDR